MVRSRCTNCLPISNLKMILTERLRQSMKKHLGKAMKNVLKKLATYCGCFKSRLKKATSDTTDVCCHLTLDEMYFDGWEVHASSPNKPFRYVKVYVCRKCNKFVRKEY